MSEEGYKGLDKCEKKRVITKYREREREIELMSGERHKDLKK